MTACRVCGHPKARAVGTLSPYEDYSCSVFDCESCGCRFTEHRVDAAERLHASASSSYRSKDALVDQCAILFRNGQTEQLRTLLSRSRTRRPWEGDS